MRTTPLALLALALSACSWLPLPTTVDLLPRLGQQASGSYRTSVVASMPAPLDAKLPDEAGAIAGFSDEAPPVTVEWGELRYDIQISYQGPALSGSLQAVLYLAPDNGERLWQEKYQLGAPLSLDLDRPTGRLAGRSKLNQDQVLALNDAKLRYGVRIRGQGVGAQESGQAVLSYTVRILKLQLGVAVF